MIQKMNYNEITAFIVGSNIYRVIGTKHAVQQMKDRRLDHYHVASACLGLGRKLDRYNNSGQQVMLIDEGKNLATVIAIENYNIVLITVIDKADVFVKPNTITESFNFKVG